MEIRKNKLGLPSYREKVYLPDGTSISKTFKRKADAVSWKAKKVTEKVTSQHLGANALKPNVSFLDVSSLWYEKKISSLKSEKTQADYHCVRKKYLIPNFGHLPIRSIERKHADALIQFLKKGNLSNKTINKILALFKQIIFFAELEGYLAKNPLRAFPALKVVSGRIDFLTPQEILQLLRANSNREIYGLLLVALNTGMRIGEITGLCWDRINFENEFIEVSRSMSRMGLKESTKTHLVRYIPMNQEVREILDQLRRNQRSPKFVFVDGKGQTYNPDHFSKRHFEKALDLAGVRRVNFHVLRHTYASQFMMNDGNIYDLQKILGHTKVDMTMKYAHLSPQHLRKSVDTVRFSAQGNMSNSPNLAPQEKRGNVHHLV